MSINYKSNSINKLYRGICSDVYFNGLNVNNTKELIDVELILTDLNNPVINLEDCKNPSIKYLLAENIWYAYGSQDVNFIGKFAHKWYEITDDGYTSNSAYGNILKYRFNFNQIEKIIDMFCKDKNTRRAILILNNPNENIDKTLDEQCTVYIQLFIRNNKLNMHVYMRSNDLILGLPYDIPAFVGLQKWIWYRLLCHNEINGFDKIQLGFYYHHVGSIHYYKQDERKIIKILNANDAKNIYNINFIRLWYAMTDYDEGNEVYSYVMNNPEKIKEICKLKDILEEEKC